MLFWNSSVEEPGVVRFLMDTSWCFERLSQSLLWIILAKRLLGKAANNLSWKSSRCVNSSNISHQEDPNRLQSVPKCSQSFQKVRRAAEQFLFLAEEINCQQKVIKVSLHPTVFAKPASPFYSSPSPNGSSFVMYIRIRR